MANDAAQRVSDISSQSQPSGPRRAPWPTCRASGPGGSRRGSDIGGLTSSSHQ